MKSRYIGLFAVITLVSGIVLAQEFSVEVYDMHPTSVRFDQPGYTPDATRRVHILENACVGGIYDVSAFPIDYSAPDGSTPPLTNPSTWLSKTKGELDTNDSIGFILNDGGRFNFAGVGQYRMEASLSVGVPGGQLSGCTEGTMVMYTVTVDQPALPPSTGTNTGSGEVSPGGNLTGSITTGTLNQGGESSSIRVTNIDEVHTDSSIQENNISGEHNGSFTTQSKAQEPVCHGRKTIREKIYDLSNGKSMINVLSLKEMVLLETIKTRYLNKYPHHIARAQAIEKVFCGIEERKQSHESGNDVYRLLQGFQDMLLLSYDSEQE